MAHHKLILDDDFTENYVLVAIHCSEESHKMAYLINQHVLLRLRRRRVDLDFSKEGIDATFPLFDFEDIHHYTTYHLVANACKSLNASINNSGSLFNDMTLEKTSMTYLLPEFRKVDYFLKVHSDFDTSSMEKLLSQINSIKQVISAYCIEPDTIKSKNNLIFD